MTTPLLAVEGLTKHFPQRAGWFGRTGGTVRAVDGVSFTVSSGATFGLVGESGCGKSTTGRMLVGLIRPTAGTVRFDGEDLVALPAAALRRRLRSIQVIFQDPVAALDPRMTVAQLIAEPMVIHRVGDRATRRRRVAELLDRVGLAAAHAARYPHAFSGGQRQRVAIARALALAPRLVICDEPVSSLDVSIQAQVVGLMQTLQRELGLAYLFISHNLAVVRHVADRVGVMYLGKLVELGSADTLFARPLHPYTQALLAAVPVPDPVRPRRRLGLSGEVPSPLNPPPGCRFHLRCPHAQPVCREVEPPLAEIAPEQWAACHLAGAG